MCGHSEEERFWRCSFQETITRSAGVLPQCMQHHQKPDYIVFYWHSLYALKWMSLETTAFWCKQRPTMWPRVSALNCESVFIRLDRICFTMRNNKQGSLKSHMPWQAFSLFTALCLTRYTRTDSIMTALLPHKQDEETGLWQGYHPLCLQHVQAVERSGHTGGRNFMPLFSVISDYMQGQLTEVT